MMVFPKKDLARHEKKIPEKCANDLFRWVVNDPVKTKWVGVGGTVGGERS